MGQPLTSWPELAAGRCPRVRSLSRGGVAERAESATDLRWATSLLSPGPVWDLVPPGKHWVLLLTKKLTWERLPTEPVPSSSQGLLSPYFPGTLIWKVATEAGAKALGRPARVRALAEGLAIGSSLRCLTSIRDQLSPQAWVPCPAPRSSAPLAPMSLVPHLGTLQPRAPPVTDGRDLPSLSNQFTQTEASALKYCREKIPR